MFSMLHDICFALGHLFYPRLCVGCRVPLTSAEDVLCFHCALQLPATGYNALPDNEAAQRFAGRIPFRHAATLAYFTDDGLLQLLLHRLKYHSRKDVGRYLGQLLGQDLAATPWIGEIDLIVPVPLHPKKEAKRGFNQSETIAAGISAATGIPVASGLLIRNRHTESQTNKTRTERVDNTANAFNVTNKEALKNKHLLLCDDVLTTGATLEACALALLAQESIKISIATIGIAVS